MGWDFWRFFEGNGARRWEKFERNPSIDVVWAAIVTAEGGEGEREREFQPLESRELVEADSLRVT